MGLYLRRYSKMAKIKKKGESNTFHKRTKGILVKTTNEEFTKIDDCAKSLGFPVSTFLRVQGLKGNAPLYKKIDDMSNQLDVLIRMVAKGKG